MKKEFYYEKVIEEIVGLIRDNLILQFNYNDEALPNIKDYCIENIEKKYEPLKYNDLLSFTEEALAELINCWYLIDFRSLE